jgi:hypothetical protein
MRYAGMGEICAPVGAPSLDQGKLVSGTLQYKLAFYLTDCKLTDYFKI